MHAVYRSVLDDYGVGIDDVAHLDLYSCFASSLHFAADALGIDLRADDRPVTVTGGLPFAGGAASNYLAHALTTMVGVLREDPGSLGLVSGVGMHMTKHGAALYSTDPGPVAIGLVPMPPAETVPIVEHHDGPATVAAYSVAHGRDGRTGVGPPRRRRAGRPGVRPGGGRRTPSPRSRRRSGSGAPSPSPPTAPSTAPR